MAGRRLTVVQLLPALEGGGVERGTLEVARALVAAGHRSVVISGGGRMVAQLLAEGSEHVTLPVGRKSLLTFRYVPRLRRLLRELDADILHARSRLPAWLGWFAWRGMAAARPRFVTTVHGFYSPGRYSGVMVRGERVIAVSRAIEGYILEHYPQVDPRRIRVIPRGVDPREFPRGFQPSPAWREQWDAAYPQLRGRLVLTLPGRITRLKGHHDLIELIACLRARGVDAHGLVVGGEDPRRRAYAGELRRAVSERGLDGHITFTGPRGDMREVYAVSAAVLSLSAKPESFGRTVLEALSLGRPVLGYAHGGVGEILADLYPQGRVANGDWHELCERLAHGPLPSVPPVGNYSLGEMTAQTLALYAELAV